MRIELRRFVMTSSRLRCNEVLAVAKVYITLASKSSARRMAKGGRPTMRSDQPPGSRFGLAPLVLSDNINNASVIPPPDEDVGPHEWEISMNKQRELLLFVTLTAAATPALAQTVTPASAPASSATHGAASIP